ncbi:MAG: response regulator [Holosporales bacterium]|jgi:two-component system cell cycle sensor histidine kinase/response regulator CckA|nr:response regulator [Holosporales bacterium]
MIAFICFSQILIAILAYMAGFFSVGKHLLFKVIFISTISWISIFCVIVTYRFLVKIREMHHKSSLARALLSMLSEADEIIIVDKNLQIVYAKHLPQEFFQKPFDFKKLVQNQFIDHENAFERCKQAILNGTYFEDVFKTAKTTQYDQESYIWLRILPVYTNGFTPNRAIIMSDVTIHRASIREIDKQHFEISRYLKSATFGAIYVGFSGEIIWCNDIVLQWLNKEKEDLFKKNIEDYIELLSEIDSPRPYSAINSAFNTDEPIYVKIKNSNKFTSVLHITKISDNRFLIILLKTESLTLAPRSKEKDNYLQNIPIPTLHIQKDGKILSVSDSFENILKKIKIGTNFFAILNETSKEQISKAIEKNDYNHSFDLQILGSDFSFSAYIKSSDINSGFILQIVDTTEQKKIEHQFAQAQKIQAVGQLAGGIAHDFNNFLTAIIGFCDLLLQRAMPNDPSYADIMQIKQNANRASALVKQLLAFSRQQSLQPKVISVKKVLTELSSLLQRLIGSEIIFKVMNKKNLWPIKADISQLEQVMINIIVNARDAMKGKGDITIETSNYANAIEQTIGNDVLAPGDYVLIKISDIGCGIPKEIIPLLFDPFFSTKEIGKGTGLGLATVYGIIKQTGGAIGVESKINVGTTFKIYLPRCFEDEEAAVTEQKSNIITDITGSETILLVEDEDAIRIFAGRALREKGYRVLEATNGQAAMELIEQGNTPNILISDVSMPQMDGPALQVAIREKIPNIPIIFTSGYAEETFRKNLSKDQSIHFLPKPFTIRELASRVREILG